MSDTIKRGILCPGLSFPDFLPGIRFYLYIFCATLANLLVTLLLPVRGCSKSRPMRPVDHGYASRLTLLVSEQCLHAPYHFRRNDHLTPPFFSRSLEIVLHSILACRLMIGIREASHGHKPETFELSAVPRSRTVEFVLSPSGENLRTDPEIYVGPSKA